MEKNWATEKGIKFSFKLKKMGIHAVEVLERFIYRRVEYALSDCLRFVSVYELYDR